MVLHVMCYGVVAGDQELVEHLLFDATITWDTAAVWQDYDATVGNDSHSDASTLMLVQKCSRSLAINEILV